MNISFKINQIICLEDVDTRLYGEVIQLIPDRKICWFRPICMTIGELNLDSGIERGQLVCLDSSSDLLWPISLFRPALDMEVISLLSELDDSKNLGSQVSNHQHFNRFVRQVWESNQDKF